MIKNILKNYIIPKIINESSSSTEYLKDKIVNIIKKYGEGDEEYLDKLHNKLLHLEKNLMKKDVLSESSDLKKNEIIEIIKNIEDEKELEQILSFLNREMIFTKMKEYFHKKFGSSGKNVDYVVANFIIESEDLLEEKLEFLNFLIKNNGLFSGSELLSKKKDILKNFILSKYKSKVLEDIFDKLMNVSGNLGFGPDQGVGEFLLVFLGKDIKFAVKSDLIIGDKIVEVKTSRYSVDKSKGKKIVGGRMTSTSGVSNPSSVKNIFFNGLKKAGISEEDLEKYKNDLNLNSKGIENLNFLILKNKINRDEIYEVFTQTIKSLFTHINEGYLGEKVNGFINFDGTINIKDFLINYSLIAFSYYKQNENFDYLMILNSDSSNFIFIENEKDILDNLNIIRFQNFLIWSESRVGSTSPQIIIK